MKIQIIAVGKKQADWINAAVDQYSKRLNKEITLQLLEMAAESNAKNLSAAEIKSKEANRIRTKLPEQNHIIALDEHGKSISTIGLSNEMQSWLNHGQSISFIIGGAEGLDADLINQADENWSLSALTLPHGLVRVVLTEQIYRAWSILKCHPYHRS